MKLDANFMLIAMHKLDHRKIPGWIQSFLRQLVFKKKKKKLNYFSPIQQR